MQVKSQSIVAYLSSLKVLTNSLLEMKETSSNGEFNLRRKRYFSGDQKAFTGQEYDFSSPPSSPAPIVSLTTPPLLVRKQHYQVITSVDFGDLSFPQLPSEAMVSYFHYV